jgi:hypothetical protein
MMPLESQAVLGTVSLSLKTLDSPQNRSRRRESLSEGCTVENLLDIGQQETGISLSLLTKAS